MSQTPRQHWMSVLSKCEFEDLQELMSGIEDVPEPVDLRVPETGLVMVRGRTGGVGNRFNLGEMTVTRCAVRMNTGETGVGYVGGRNKAHARLAAVADGLLQNSQWQQRLADDVIAPLAARYEDSQTETQRKRAATRVDFFTMTRTREDKK